MKFSKLFSRRAAAKFAVLQHGCGLCLDLKAIVLAR
jgi:hypothetical protein